MLNIQEKKALTVALIRKMQNADSWTGETHIQKCTYFLEEFFNIELNYDFILYKHGPFSFDLRDELGALRADDFIVMEPRRPFGASFKPSKRADLLENKYNNLIREYDRELSFVVDRLANKSVKELEKVATALYVRNTEGITDNFKIAKKIVKLKPHVSLEDAQSAAEELSGYISEVDN
ncbi:hypothetical protein SAMN04488598_10723 [Halanaerobium congolense]|uniref:Antitoxin SocA-like Panacea domain-containing protein n=1 Tax=Halanaerobium congolense TaxID=54121 RepID=A0A1H9ZS02_9FIRM|nr:hypothetical protein [Halanaerobium congolense]PTX16350.1 hypothetical protein C7953_1064 [Halanaerobium congolense]SDF15679.1 hypothetical protein SAMN04488598_10723 [Halanaerobium congolense]SES84133.1 hypothetical protein SAMN04515652_10823 [Halanaerobium congolense]SFP44976.1 hypothetical protein SAMN04488596_12023 [Halanaerobium congolense]